MTKHLTTKELAERLRLHPGTLYNWRAKNLGPKCMKLGNKLVYSIKEVEAWELKITKGK